MSRTDRLTDSLHNESHNHNTRRVTATRAGCLLKTLVDNFTVQKDAHEEELRREERRAGERTLVRRDAVHALLTMRSAGEPSRAKWSSVIEPNFRMSLPRSKSPQQPPPPATVGGGAPPPPLDAMMMVDQGGPLEVEGIDAVVSEAIESARLLRSFGESSAVRYTVSDDDVLGSADKLMCRWSLKTSRRRIEASGMLYATFTPQVRCRLAPSLSYVPPVHAAAGPRRPVHAAGPRRPPPLTCLAVHRSRSNPTCLLPVQQRLHAARDVGTMACASF